MPTMPGFGTGLPPEIEAEQQRIAKQQAIAEAMLQRGLTPIQQQGAPIHWTQGLAQMFQSYTGRRGMDDAAKSQAALGGKYQQGLADEVARIAKLRQGTPATTDAADNIQDPGVQGDSRAAVMEALTSQYGPVRKMGELDFQADLKSREAAAARAARLEERAMVLEQQSQDRAIDRESRERLSREANEIRLQIAELTKAAGAGRSPYFTPVYTPGGVLSFNNREGTAAPLLVDGQRVVRSQDDPDLQGRIVKKKKEGEHEAKREFNMAGIGATIDRAEKILKGFDPDTGAARPTPTGSGMGAIVDKVGGFFGASPEGAKEANDLKAVGGALTSKMPRMEGPQSDRDTQLYREMAAQIGDETVPVPQRLRALETVKALWRKYEKQNPDQFEGGGAAPAALPEGVSQQEWDAMTEEEKALFR